MWVKCNFLVTTYLQSRCWTFSLVKHCENRKLMHIMLIPNFRMPIAFLMLNVYRKPSAAIRRTWQTLRRPKILMHWTLTVKTVSLQSGNVFGNKKKKKKVLQYRSNLNKNGFILILSLFKLKQLWMMTEWEYDSTSGYYYNQTNGFYYDSSSGFYYSDTIGTDWKIVGLVSNYLIPFLYDILIECAVMAVCLNAFQASGWPRKRPMRHLSFHQILDIKKKLWKSQCQLRIQD